MCRNSLLNSHTSLKSFCQLEGLGPDPSGLHTPQWSRVLLVNRGSQIIDGPEAAGAAADYAVEDHYSCCWSTTSLAELGSAVQLGHTKVIFKAEFVEFKPVVYGYVMASHHQR